MSNPIVEALKAIRKHHPTVTKVTFKANGMWVWTDANDIAPEFTGFNDNDIAKLSEAFDYADEMFPLPVTIIFP